MSLPIRFIKKENVAEGTEAFYFSKPEEFAYQAGQSIDLTVAGMTNAFSIFSAPYEGFLSIATRMRESDYKNALKKMEAGKELSMEGPFGSMTLHNDVSKKAVFLAGGIGITPFYSIIKQATFEKLPHQIFLFYSNRRREEAPFFSELENLEKQNPNFKLISITTAVEGHLTKEKVLEVVPDLAASIGYIAGPAKMVHAMRELLNSAGLNDDYIRSEEFSGYE
jgi:ferredoxin-NADP reductase